MKTELKTDALLAAPKNCLIFLGKGKEIDSIISTILFVSHVTVLIQTL